MKQIPGYPDYACDEQGNVYSLKYGKIQKLKPSFNSKGYQRVAIYVNGIARLHRVHRLITKTFLKDYSEDLQVDHIDRCPTNNSLDNLRMVTPSENRQNNDAKGYSWDNRAQKWRAVIRVNSKQISLGSYNTEEEARAAYLKGKEKHHTH